MTLYKATKDGNIPMTAQEEAEIRAIWAANDSRPPAIKPKPMDERMADIEARVTALEKAKA